MDDHIPFLATPCLECLVIALDVEDDGDESEFMAAWQLFKQTHRVETPCERISSDEPDIRQMTLERNV